jgi:hypothetical protein
VFFEGNCKMGTSNSPKDAEHTSTSSNVSNNQQSWQKKEDKQPVPAGAR